MLPRQRGLVVWVIAPFPRRIERAMQRWDLPEPKARKRIETVDSERRTFVQRFFRRLGFIAVVAFAQMFGHTLHLARRFLVARFVLRFVIRIVSHLKNPVSLCVCPRNGP